MNVPNYVMDREVHDVKLCRREGCNAKSNLSNVHIDGKIHRYWCCTSCAFAERSKDPVRADYYGSAVRSYDRRSRVRR